MVIATIEKKNGRICFDDLENVTGFSFMELSVAVAQLIQDDKVLLRVNHSTEIGFTYKSAGDVLYERFMDLLFLRHGKKWSVTFYASELCVTPKYLSSIVKKVSGKTPTEWINENTVHEIEYRLCHTQASIKEIAYELDFPNVSFFGKFFKSHKGISPKRYRETCIKNYFCPC